jgi:hypothetical protein
MSPRKHAAKERPPRRYAVAISTATRPFTYTVVAHNEMDAVLLAVESHVLARRPGILHTDVRHMGAVSPDVNEPPLHEGR